MPASDPIRRDEHVLPCCVDAPADFAPKARYAIETLLLGLGLSPHWREKSELGNRGLYYGPATADVPQGALSIFWSGTTLDYFSQRRPYQPDEFGSLDWDSEHWSLPFGKGQPGVAQSLPDVVAASFFWLSGWQEYSTVVRDQHGRFPFAASFQASKGLALHPLVDVYRSWLADRLTERGIATYPRTWSGNSWAVAITHDVDFIEVRPLSRIRAAFAGKLREAVSNRGTEDPRRAALDRMRLVVAERNAAATYFLKGGATSPFDVEYSLDSPWLQRFLVDATGRGNEVGVHPSYAAFDHPELLREEVGVVARAVGAKPRSARMHFLRWTEPTTPRLLSQTGIELDSTLGFSEHPGFRRGTCHPFRLYDIPANRELDLWEWPLAVMDSTLFTHQRLSAEEALQQIRLVFDAVRRVGGCAVLLWHNTPANAAGYADHMRVFESALDAALADGAHLGSLQEMMQCGNPV